MTSPSDCDRQLAESQALAHVGSWEWDTSQERIWWSEEMCRIHGREPGFSPTPAEGLAHLHPDDHARVAGIVDRAVADGLRYRIVRADGEIRHVHGRRQVRRDGSGTIVLMYGTTQDITEQREAELARDHALGLLESAFSGSAVGMSITDLDGRWLRVNRALCRLTGWSEAEMLARTFQGITHPDDLQADLELLARTLAGEIDDYQMEKRYLTRDGAAIWVLLSVALVRDERGEPRHLVGQVQDISARKQAEERLRAAEAEARLQRDRAQTIVSAMHEGYGLTVNGEIAAVNEAWCTMVGYSAQELIGLRPPYPFWPDNQHAALAGTVARIRAENGGTCEAEFVRRDGTRFDAEITARQAFGADGEAIGFVNTLRDVSDRNRRQRRLEYRARTDSLTGLANRYVLEEALGREVRRRAGGQTLALVLLDLDGFKQVNDCHGHPVGDAVLIESARRLSRIVREGEVLARAGGEEFAWLLLECDIAGACAAADRAREIVRRDAFADAGSLTVSAGIGVAEIPCDGRELYELADRALYDAKRNGRDRTCVRARTSGFRNDSEDALDGVGKRLGDWPGSDHDLLAGAAAWHAERDEEQRARGARSALPGDVDRDNMEPARP